MNFSHQIALAAMAAVLSLSIGPACANATPAVPAAYDFQFQGDILGAVQALQAMDPTLRVMTPIGRPVPVPVNVAATGGTMEALRQIGEQGGNQVDVIYANASNQVSLVFRSSPTAPALSSAPEPAPAARKPVKVSAVQAENDVQRFPYGMGIPTLVCMPLRACDIELQPGEKITNPVLGDSVRWITAFSTSGEGDTATPHVTVKPLDANLATNLQIFTNRRVYKLNLESSANRHMAAIGFYYPQDMAKTWEKNVNAARKEAQDEDQRKVSDMPLLRPDQLNFKYTIDGDNRLAWYPIRAFDDGSRVYIQMNPGMNSSEAPALVLIGKDGNSELVNYRVKSGYYIVDKLFDKAALIVGVGRDQTKVEISKGSGGFFGWLGGGN
ncbi:P-type conjugative transfer protein TrbG [Cupriavidus pauculus]|uniref:P-type conjugative transfer protein TrbG n=1 Tax=Cupriavidus pauculus TaxID=82633 RepID=UPI003857DBE5